jgi:hypothetical protein
MPSIIREYSFAFAHPPRYTQEFQVEIRETQGSLA